MEIAQFIIMNAEKLTIISLETLIIVGLVYLLVYIFKYIMKIVREETNYLIAQVAERNDTIQEMTKVLLESQEVLNKLANRVDNNKKEIIGEIEKRILQLTNEIQKVLIHSAGGGNKE